eukprot:Partr_v1_DN23545_c0_g1_i1_m14433 putative casein kinase ii
MSSASESEDDEKYWVDWFLSLKGNEFFCEVDHDYIADRFNLTGLHTDVPYYTQALNLILDQMADNMDEATRVEVEKAARNLYGLIHARYIITGKGLTKMVEKYRKGQFGRCPRVHCENQPVLPVGQTDSPYQKAVKLFCPKCEDIYTPRSSRHQYLDGAFFGTTFPHMLLQMFAEDVPKRTADRYIPRIFGFKIRDFTQSLVEPSLHSPPLVLPSQPEIIQPPSRSDSQEQLGSARTSVVNMEII